MDRRDFLLGTSAAALTAAVPMTAQATYSGPWVQHVTVVKRLAYMVDENGCMAEVLPPLAQMAKPARPSDEAVEWARKVFEEADNQETRHVETD